MKNLLKLIIFIILLGMPSCMATEYRILVIPDNIFLTHKDYFIYPETSELFATDIINYFNKHQDMSAPSVNNLKVLLDKDSLLKKQTKELMSKYKNTYMINFDTVQKVSSKFKASKALLITSSLDIQNYILRRTLWDFLNISGATVTDPAYRISTQVTLIDVNNQVILWQENYQKLISSRENRMIAETFSPASEQLEKIKKYSTRFLAPQIVQEVQLALFHVDEYTDLTKHPEIVKQETITIDRVKIGGRRTAVRTGRAAKKETKSFIATQKIKIHNAKVKQLENKAKKKELKEQKKILKEKQKFKTVEIIKQEPVQNINVPQSEIIKQQEIKPSPYIRTKPRLREDMSTINDI